MHSINAFAYAIYNKWLHILYGILLNFIFACNQLPFLSCPTSRLSNLIDITKSLAKDNSLTTNLEKAKPKGDFAPKSSLYLYPLHRAVRDNNLDWAKFILQQDKTKANQKDNQGYLPIHWAVDGRCENATGSNAKKNLKILQVLLAYPSSSQRDKNGMTVLHWAVYAKHLNAVKAILKYFRKNFKTQFLNFINQKDKNGFIALHGAVDRGKKRKYTEKHLQILKEILHYSGKHIDTRDNHGMTVLHWAVAMNNLEAVETILKYAKATLTYEAYKTFVQMPAFIDPKTGEGSCPAIYWAASPEYPVENGQLSRERSLKIFKLLLPACEINYQDNQGYTMAHWATVQGRNDIFKLLIEQGADLNLRDNKGHTVSMKLTQVISAVYNGQSSVPIENLTKQGDSILKLLNLARAKIDAKNNQEDKAKPFKKRKQYKII